jgi:ABC-type Fe3+/spermidine/putrescine transport system ATPase subunit
LTLRARATPHSGGDRVVAMMRPEHIRLVGAGEAMGHNGLNALIKEATYLGQDFHLHLDVSGGQELTVVTRHSGARRLSAGDEVVVTVDAADIILLPK